MSSSSANSQSAYFPIRVVSSETGVNAITLRAWERRYGLITPKRTAKGHRLYTEADIVLVKQVVTLLDKGIPISQAQAMIEQGGDLAGELSAITSGSVQGQPASWGEYRAQLAQRINELNDSALFELFQEVTQFFPIDICLKHLFLPQLRTIIESGNSLQSRIELQFYRAFLNARLAWRISEPCSVPHTATIAVASTAGGMSTEALMLAGILRPLGIRPVCFEGPLGISEITLLISKQFWQGGLICLPSEPSPVLLQQLQTMTIETGCPIFCVGNNDDSATALRHHGIIALPNDITTASTIIRDTVSSLAL